jgi:hypothetical protein
MLVRIHVSGHGLVDTGPVAFADVVLKRAVLGLSILLVLLLAIVAIYGALADSDTDVDSSTGTPLADDQISGEHTVDTQPTSPSTGSASTGSSATVSESATTPSQDTTGSSQIDDPSGPDRDQPPTRLEIGDERFPLSIVCRPASAPRDDGSTYVVVIENRADEEVDYLVRADLVDADGRTTAGLAEANGLRSGEEREVVLVPDRTVDDPVGCSIRAIQGNRRVLLAG